MTQQEAVWAMISGAKARPVGEKMLVWAFDGRGFVTTTYTDDKRFACRPVTAVSTIPAREEWELVDTPIEAFEHGRLWTP